MILRIGRGHIKPGAWEGFETAWRETLIESDWPEGLRARWLAQDVNDRNGGWTISLWDDVESIESWQESDGYASVVAALTPFYVGDYQAQVGEVRVSETSAAA